ncbi:uncharacterized protein LOC126900541 isoform X2 [Daktulosphaira vitifoliae]|uniref:uncharacterized protein LOC126900541 isoform X2 n=1 Tax=Daktulosphaira vitifoliae TaxID=58002 RepID=UPI0021AAFC02|nr:uncharacterized protein LOC126900541 isoform X2 [Daktulosphaira vitifoliae]
MPENINVIVEEVSPYLHLSTDSNNAIKNISGFVGEIWNIIENQLSFKSNYTIAQFPEGRALIHSGEADIMLIPMVITATDVDEFDFTIPFFKSWYELYSKHTVNRATSMSYLVTWSPGVWLAFALTTLLIAACGWLVMKVRSYTSTSRHDSEIPNIISCVFIVWGSICSQGMQAFNTACSVRTLAWVTLGFGLCMSTAYSAVLFSRLAVGKNEKAVPSLEAAAYSTTLSLCVRRHSFAFVGFKVNEDDEFITEKWRKVVNKPPCYAQDENASKMAKMVCKDNVLVLETPNIMAQSMFEQGGCRVVSLAGKMSITQVSLLTKKKFRYLSQINEILLRLLTSGVLNYLQNKWVPKEFPETFFTPQDISVTLSHVEGLLFGFFIAVMLSVVVLMIEHIVAKYNTYKTKSFFNTRILRSMGNPFRFQNKAAMNRPTKFSREFTYVDVPIVTSHK